MKNDFEAYRDIRKELNDLNKKINNLIDFKYGNTLEFLKLGSDMCSLLDIQENSMKSYRDVLLARLILLDEKMIKENKYE